jgi:hypothetical protein
MTVRALRRAHTLIAALVGIVACTAPSACQEFGEVTQVDCPPIDDFGVVSSVFAQRCGTIDCHGSLARPLKIYGQYGLRLFDLASTPEELEGQFPAGNTRTQGELEANWRAVCGLEPDKTTAVTNGAADPDTLLLLSKPLGIERHKGKVLFDKNDEAYLCIRTWLLGQTDTSLCTVAAQPE